MITVAQHQDAAARFLDHSELEAKAGNSYRSVLALSRATSHAATAANIHWGMFAHNHRRQLSHVLYTLARQGHLSYTSARFLNRFEELYRDIQKAERARNRPEARRLFRNARRRTAHTIAAVNRAIAADPNPKPHWQITAEVVAEAYPDPQIPHPDNSPSD